MATRKLTNVQLAKIKDYASRINEQNPHIKIIPVIMDGVLLSISVRFLPPKSWSEVTPENCLIEDLIFDEIERRSRYRLFPERNGLFRKGILELKYSSVHRLANERCIIAVMEFIADDLIEVMIGKKEVQ